MCRSQQEQTDTPCLMIFAVMASLVLPHSARAMMTSPSLVCERVAAIAAEQTGVPIAVLHAISLTETGRVQDKALRPWPWTVNMEGKGHWFDTVDEARAYVFSEFKRGARSFDVGCFQINYKWHGEAFTSIDQMFDPVANAIYAAGLLRDLYSETGSWSQAAGAYHSRTPEYATRYRARFDRILAGLDGEAAVGQSEVYAADIPEIPDIVAAMAGGDSVPALPRVNSFPLLMAGASSGLGSLVPNVTGSGASLFPAAATPASDTPEELLP